MLLRQFRHAAGGEIWEVPAGKPRPPRGSGALRRPRAGGGDWLSRGAHRADRLDPDDAGLHLDERIHLFCAYDLVAGRARPRRTRCCAARSCRLARALAMIESGEICDGKTIAALFLAAHRGHTRREVTSRARRSGVALAAHWLRLDRDPAAQPGAPTSSAMRWCSSTGTRASPRRRRSGPSTTRPRSRRAGALHARRSHRLHPRRATSGTRSCSRAASATTQELAGGRLVSLFGVGAPRKSGRLRSPGSRTRRSESRASDETLEIRARWRCSRATP